MGAELRSASGSLASLAFLLCGVLAGTPVSPVRAQATPPGAPTARLLASPEPGWPQWRGPRRDGLCDETGLLQQWPEGGPRLLWHAKDLGRGWSAPILTGGCIYLAGDVGEELHIFALDLNGRRLWQSRNGLAWKGPYPGARSSCTYREGCLYHSNAHGRVACLDAATGRELWAVDTRERFGGNTLTWGLSENLLVDGSKVIVTPGGTRALMAALDRKTGATVWMTEPLRLGRSDDPSQARIAEPAGEIDNASYASPILFALGGRRHLVGCSLRHAFGVDADTGELLWTRPVPTRFSVIAATPVLVGDAVFVTAPDTEAGKLFRLITEGPRVRVETLWTTDLDTCHGGLVHVNGALYGSFYRRSKGWASLDARTGRIGSRIQDLAMGAVLYADERLYGLSQEGEMTLIKPTPGTLEFKGRFRLVPERTTDAWTHPVIFQRRLHLRYHETLSCYDLRR